MVADSRQVSGAVVAQDLPRIFAGVCAGQQVQDSQPDIVASHNDDDDLDEGGQLVGDHALIAQVAEGSSDIEGQHGDDDLTDDVQHDVLEFAEDVAGQLAVGPGSSQTHQNTEHEGAHDAHIIIGFIAPSITKLGKNASRLLGVAIVIGVFCRMRMQAC